ncbi:hypothetical protein SS50377_27080 [Spironucleus salmonicida]|uniref:Uncharacterized protein n=1 Tax=Spironucleus salmonicida TaxID=348837 RepID=V6LQ70_9EUKA|nr:hypothetical protein SS50377_27080 [Spironucleus salmonicida]|eukprot:EST46725.1 Hypothetical protein SS50377_13239 [Spironucleus salmonicida]
MYSTAKVEAQSADLRRCWVTCRQVGRLLRVHALNFECQHILSSSIGNTKFRRNLQNTYLSADARRVRLTVPVSDTAPCAILLHLACYWTDFSSSGENKASPAVRAPVWPRVAGSIAPIGNLFSQNYLNRPHPSGSDFHLSHSWQALGVTSAGQPHANLDEIEEARHGLHSLALFELGGQKVHADYLFGLLQHLSAAIILETVQFQYLCNLVF